jgi:hypothetical protein
MITIIVVLSSPVQRMVFDVLLAMPRACAGAIAGGAADASGKRDYYEQKKAGECSPLSF